MDEKIDQHDLAKYLGVSTRTVRNLIKRGALPPPVRIGRKRIWLKRKFMDWLEGDGAVRVQTESAAKSLKRCSRTKLPA